MPRTRFDEYCKYCGGEFDNGNEDGTWMSQSFRRGRTRRRYVKRRLAEISLQERKLAIVVLLLVVGVGAYIGWKMLNSPHNVTTSAAVVVAPAQSKPVEQSALLPILDETIEQVERIMGTNQFSFTEGDKSIRFYTDHKGEFSHQITFIGGTAVSIQYGRNDRLPLTSDQVRRFLEANANGQTWVEAEQGRMWTRNHQEVIAEWMPTMKHLFSVVYMKVAKETVQGWVADSSPQPSRSGSESSRDIAPVGNNIPDARQHYKMRIVGRYYLPASKGAEWYRKAADQGDQEAQYYLGVCYADGRGVPKDLSKAAEWWRKAADQGDGRAQNNLAELAKAPNGDPLAAEAKQREKAPPEQKSEPQEHDISPAEKSPPTWQVHEAPSQDGVRVFDENQYLAKHYGRFGGAFTTVDEAAEKARVLNFQQTANLDAMKEAVHNGGNNMGTANFRFGHWTYAYDKTVDRFVVYQE